MNERNSSTAAAMPVAAEVNIRNSITANCVRYVAPDSPE